MMVSRDEIGVILSRFLYVNLLLVLKLCAASIGYYVLATVTSVFSNQSISYLHSISNSVLAHITVYI